MPKLWEETIEEHRREVREAILNAAAALSAAHGLRAVTMLQVAEQAGIGRATLYKYFSNVEEILLAWHERQIDGHMALLTEVRDRAGGAREQLQAVLEAYAMIAHESIGNHTMDLADFLHHDEQVSQARHRLLHMIGDLLAEAAKAGEARDDIAPEELASFCMHALTGASRLPSKAAVKRLVVVTLDGLRPDA